MIGIKDLNVKDMLGNRQAASGARHRWKQIMCMLRALLANAWPGHMQLDLPGDASCVMTTSTRQINFRKRAVSSTVTACRGEGAGSARRRE